MIGLELSFKRLWAMRRLVFGLGVFQVVVTGTIISVIAILFKNTVTDSVIIGAAFALSSTAIVMQILTENQRLGTATGRITFSILLLQDLAVLPILLLVGAFASQGEESVVAAFAWAIGLACVAVAGISVLGRLVIGPLFRFIGKEANQEMFLALVLLIIIGTAVATEHVGLSMPLGAFLAGLILAETEYRHEVEVNIEPFKGMFLALFFISIGMTIDLAVLVANPVWILASVAGLFLIKSPIVYVLARLYKQPRSVSLEAGLLLGQGGEFAFVVLGLALSLELMSIEIIQFMLIVAGLAMIVTPFVAHLSRKLARRVEISEQQENNLTPNLPDELSGHVIIVGHGRVGRMVGSILSGQEISYVALDNDIGKVADYQASGACVFFGDVNRIELLRKFHIDEALALVITMDDALATERVVVSVRRHWPDLVIYVRARDKVHAARLISHGANHVILETTETSLQLGELVLKGVGVPDSAARQLIDSRRLAEQVKTDEL